MTASDAVPTSWRDALAPALSTPQAGSLFDFLQSEEAAGKVIYPPRDQRFAALDLTPLDMVKVVILGQDPYHGPGQAHGLSFSVQRGVRIPPSLANIYKELKADIGFVPPAHGDLSGWARQGVLLLNNALSVEQGKAGSHQKKGWEAITDACVAAVAGGRQPCVFMLWGSHAQKKAARVPGLLDGRHLVLNAPHPSPLSAYNGWFGSGHFSKANEFLVSVARDPVDWAAQ